MLRNGCDIALLFTGNGVPGGGRAHDFKGGFLSNGNACDSALVSISNNIAWVAERNICYYTTAHEIGHLMGLGHQDGLYINTET